ncbi:MAG: BON domain-containing protein [Tatlockia sp.]|jgi:osmotically-inducible protein OsmY
MNRIYRNALTGLCLIVLVGCNNYVAFAPWHPDKGITTAVYSALVNSDLATANIHVITQNGTVVLSGYVKTIRQSDMAGEIASHISGVRSVQNELIVRK